MSTRSIFTFREAQESFHVYAHSDGYPAGAICKVRNALPYAWTLPRFEADEFAAAFVAGNKSTNINSFAAVVLARARAMPEPEKFGDYPVTFTADDPLIVDRYMVKGQHGGGVRLLASGDWRDVAPGDIAYRYEVTHEDGRLGRGLMVRGYSVDSGDWNAPTRAWSETELFHVPLASLAKKDFKALGKWEERIVKAATKAAA